MLPGRSHLPAAAAKLKEGAVRSGLDDDVRMMCIDAQRLGHDNFSAKKICHLMFKSLSSGKNVDSPADRNVE